MAISRRYHRRHQQAKRRHLRSAETLEKRYALNIAPVLVPNGYDGDGTHNRFDLVVENSGAPVGQVGKSVAQIIGTITPNNFSDSNNDRPGIAITDTNLLGGTLWVSHDDGRTWSDIGPIGETDPFVAPSESSTRLYFQPATEFHGTIKDVITFKAWDTRSSYVGMEHQLHGQSVGEQTKNVALSFDGAVMIVGAPESDINGDASGNVRVFRQNGDQWQQIGGTLHGLSGDKFGQSVAISDDGNIIAIGAHYGDSPSKDDNVGYVSVFENDGGNWVQRGANILGESEGELSGFSIALSSNGERLAVGSIFGLDANAGSAGLTRVYEWSDASWSQVSYSLSSGEIGDQFGYSVDLSSDGRVVAIGAPLTDTPWGTPNAGRVDVFRDSDAGWVRVRNFSYSYPMVGAYENERLGHAVSLSADGTRIAVGSPNSLQRHDGVDQPSGRVRIFDFSIPDWSSNGETWHELGGTPYAEWAGDRFGSAVSLSDDGLTLVVGAPDNDFESESAGGVYVYQLNNASHPSFQISTYTYGHVADEQFGSHVAISGNGRVVVGSSPNSDVSHEDAGVVRALRQGPGFGSISEESDTMSVYVQENPGELLPANSPPTLDVSKNPVFEQARFSVPPVGAVGVPVSNLLDESGVLGNYSDADDDAPGVAVVGANIGSGRLWYTIDNGDSWAAVGNVSVTSARVLFANSQTRLFYQSPEIEDDSDALNIQFKAWDRTGFSNGASGVDTTVSMAPDSLATYDFEGLLRLADVYGSYSNLFTWPRVSSSSSYTNLTEHSQRLVDSDYQSESNLLIVASRTAFSLRETTNLQESTQLSRYQLFERPGYNQTYGLSDGQGYSVIAGVNFCGPDVLVVEAHEVYKVSWNSWQLTQHWLVFDIRSPDSPRLVQQFSGTLVDSDFLQKSAMLWHGNLGLGYSESPANPFGGYFQVAEGRLVDSTVNLRDTGWEHASWHYGDNDQWYGQGYVRTSNEFAAEYYVPEYFVVLEKGGNVTSIAASGDFDLRSLRGGYFDLNSNFALQPSLSQVGLSSSGITDLNLLYEGQGVLALSAATDDYPGDFSNMKIQTARIKNDGTSYFAVTSFGSVSWDGVLAVGNPWTGANNFVDSSFSVEGSVADLEFDASERILFVTDSSGLVYVLDTESVARFSSRIETASIDLTKVSESSGPYRNVLPDVYVAPPATGSTASAVVSLEEALDVVPTDMPIAVTAVSENRAVIRDPVVLVGDDGRPSSLVLTGEAGVSGSAAVRVVLHTGGLDKDLDTPDDNQSAEYIFKFTQLRPYGLAGGSLATDESNLLYVESEPVTLSGKAMEVEYFAFQPVAVAPSPEHNQLIVERNGTNYRLIADDAWRVSGIFESLQNESSPVLDLSARELPEPLDVLSVSGAFVISNAKNPVLIVRRGQRYTFTLDLAGHPFYLQTTGGGYVEANVYSEGFTGNGETTGRFEWVVSEDAPDELFYQCEFHPVMFGKIIVVN